MNEFIYRTYLTKKVIKPNIDQICPVLDQFHESNMTARDCL